MIWYYGVKATVNGEDSMVGGPLSDIRVIDLTRILAGPFCTMILKNLGAEVIKIERPMIGDESRYFGPFSDKEQKQSGYFLSVNAGKKSLVLDLNRTRGKEVLADLIGVSDVLVENFRPGVLERLGFPPGHIKRLNPNIIYASASGFGHTGPDTQKPAFDMIIQAASGIMSITGFEDGSVTRVGTSIGDIVTGMYTAIGIIAALFRRSKNGGGARVDVAMLDSMVSILENAIIRYQVTQQVPGPIGSRHPSITPFGCFRARDGVVVIAAGHDRHFELLCDLIGRPELKNDDRFSTNDLRTRNVRDLTKAINDALSHDAAEVWIKKLDRAGIVCGKINTVKDLFQSEQIKMRNMLVPLEGGDPLLIAGNPIKYDDVPDALTAGTSPVLGEHNEEIMRTVLGYSHDEIEELCKEVKLLQSNGTPSEE